MRPIATPEGSDDALRARFDDASRPAAARDEVDWYVARLPRGAGLCLDAMCGSGRLLVPLVARGVALQGADASGAALALAEARLAAAGRTTTLYRQSLQALNLPTRYAAAILDGSAFARIADPVAARVALERLRMHLVDPGLSDRRRTRARVRRIALRRAAGRMEERRARRRLADPHALGDLDRRRRAPRAHRRALHAPRRHARARRGLRARRGHLVRGEASSRSFWSKRVGATSPRKPRPARSTTARPATRSPRAPDRPRYQEPDAPPPPELPPPPEKPPPDEDPPEPPEPPLETTMPPIVAEPLVFMSCAALRYHGWRLTTSFAIGNPTT
jgi:SAM-dependent methyltransferase